ncbi:MAG TPA: PLP-dependent aspartate aminotransferase family protein [Kribbella sp.]|uniref:trans-sulfuration enzyme family protein n=1 Tax=Kribbella sp. TaxID=1871183 RepID=UPI002D779E40|nr:PLP-dependent aspartate aminotransferase family protein [Kribbella sp.]HET6292576.1 PLP-dependent aspartate aminotransferase family protein [Kribbella sp.]
MTQPDTRSVHAGRDDLRARGLHVPPIDLSTTYPLTDLASGGAAYERLASGNAPGRGSLVYQRLWNPNVARLEEALAELESCEGAVAFGTGMAALSACLLATVANGKPHVVAVRPLYGGSDHLLSTGLLGTTVSWSSPGGIAEAVQPDTGLVILETPANPTLELVDIADVVRQAGDVPVLVDNTFATPVLQRPVEYGATLVLHSATKYLGGHGDVMGGLVAGNADWVERLRRIRAVTGGLLHPLAAYELHRGLQTLPVRVRAQQAGAEKVADLLCTHPAVDNVFYPGLPECDPLGLVGRQQAGPGAVLAFTTPAAEQLLTRLELITHAVSLGGVDTLIQHPAGLTHRLVADEAKPDQGLLRLSVGLEDPDDLVRDLAQALG